MDMEGKGGRDEERKTWGSVELYTMGLLTTSLPVMCPRDKHCSEWARQYIKYCLCDVRDGVSLALGLVSVISWGVAEIPQIITNSRKKSTEGLSIAFLMTWIVGDMFNFFGCMLEPATTEAVEKRIPCSGVAKKQDNAIDDFGLGVAQSSPIPLPGVPRSSSLERELYYMSARSLTRSHTPTSGSFLAQRITLTTLSRQNTFEEPLLGGLASTQSAPRSNNKSMLCAFSAVTFFLGTLNLHLTESNGLHMVSGKRYKGVVMQVGRKLLQVSGGFMEETGGAGSSRIGTLLGWGMAAIYMGGRLPQICLNFQLALNHLKAVCLDNWNLEAWKYVTPFDSTF
ncbi:hypothetical protein RHMOL_Rhmol03G0046800 [Rhododendron molle]|uniref:Uncharacterized protein n=1 Tax=Rhododendron molle TaxID=49168 RepID=A0ACC0PBR7_RHOML|nr:hypothetical protein RHMOL_Rhmol03G0046800 [Rhododendron molle]